MTAIQKTNAGLNLFRNSEGGTDSAKITYFALGTSNTTPAASDTKLGAEVFRKAVTSYTIGATGEITVVGYLAPGDAVGVVIAEIGIFGGNAATSSPNTGTLIAHGLYSHTKVNTEGINFSIDSVLS